MRRGGDWGIERFMKNEHIVFTGHALLKLEQRSISQRLVIQTIDNPEKLTYDSVAEKFFAFRKFGKLYLRVFL